MMLTKVLKKFKVRVVHYWLNWRIHTCTFLFDLELNRRISFTITLGASIISRHRPLKCVVPPTSSPISKQSRISVLIFNWFYQELCQIEQSSFLFNKCVHLFQNKYPTMLLSHQPVLAVATFHSNRKSICHQYCRPNSTLQRVHFG